MIIPLSSCPVSPIARMESIPARASSTALLEANPLRVGAIIYNDSTSTLRIRFGSGASNTDFSVVLTARALFEVPFGYPGDIDGIWEASNGAARITEFVRETGTG